MNLRADLQLLYDWIPAKAHVLDLGCSSGELLHALMNNKQVTGYGVEIDSEKVIMAINSGVNVIQGNLEHGLPTFDTQSFDVVVLSQTIQAMQQTEAILLEMLRVGKQALVTFPNFGYWKNRIQIMQGHMPVSDDMPYDWYNTPNIHWCMLGDFEHLCSKNNIPVLERTVMTDGKRINFMPNLLGSLAFYRVGKA
ncbi:methionine biosynthesis protein MetW [Neisseria sp. Ec49-e6-T10]|uniref:methionine biosynthesis protein MetW n=1 Tax=Neisseria sp. Ec49-e6-T10 TaxID=3140744 RepID=UPI003EB8A97A